MRGMSRLWIDPAPRVLWDKATRLVARIAEHEQDIARAEETR